MDIFEAIKLRRSVRRYKDIPIEEDILNLLKKEIDECNKESGLNIQLIINEPKAFSGKMANYGHFKGVKNYIALVGKNSSEFTEKCGYYGQRIVLKAQQLGLNTCWVALTYSKQPEFINFNKGEKLHIVISVGYGEYQGNTRKSKSVKEISNVSETSPEWFKRGVEAAILAPTAVNQQKFYLKLNSDNTVTAKAKVGFYTKTDLGIVKYNFEAAAGKENVSWK
ncbi:MAG: nitroreductase [Clostridia bacterium]|nr:nitroreductase [Clostridia bacterium]